MCVPATSPSSKGKDLANVQYKTLVGQNFGGFGTVKKIDGENFGG